MDPAFWRQTWSDDRIGFHQTRPNGRLVAHWPTLELAADTPVFVPLCGKSLDLLWLHERGHPVIGVELSEKAVRAFFEENALSHRHRPDGHFERWSGRGAAAGIELLVGDFFELAPTDLDGVGAVYDRASLIAMNDALRGRYARHLAHLLPVDCDGLLVTIDYDPSRMQGPPFPVPAATVHDLLGEAFDIDELAHYSGAERLGNLADRGLESLDERVHRLRRT